MRIKIPKLLDVPDNVEKLQQGIAGARAVRNFRINPAAESIVIEYQESKISEIDLQKQLATLLTTIVPKTSGEVELHESTEPIATWSIALTEVDNLTPYEQTQLEQIDKWRSR